MVRDEYVQDTVNPVQLDLVPERQTDLTFPCAPVPFWDAWAVIAHAVKICLCVSLLASLANYSQDAPAFFVWSLIVILAVAVIYRIWVGLSPLRSLAFLGPVGAAAICLYFRPSFALLLLLTALFVGWATIQFGHHWAVICAASRFPQTTARRFVRAWLLCTALFAATPVIAFVAWKGFEQPLIAVGILAVVLLVQVFHLLPSTCKQNRFRILFDAIVSWLTYNPTEKAVPGLQSSPVGTCRARICYLYVLVFLITSALAKGVEEVAATTAECRHTATAVSEPSSERRQYGTNDVTQSKIDHAAVETPSKRPKDWIDHVPIALLLLPVTGICTMLPPILAWSVLTDAAGIRDVPRQQTWDQTSQALQNSTNPIERRAVYMGKLGDGSPLLVPRAIFHNHAHFLGDSGSGKSSKGLAPLMEQLIRTEECSIITLDLKADSLELLAAMHAAADWVRRRSGRILPIKGFTNQDQYSTFAFNPLELEFWNDLNLYMKTDILCGALGLTYGPDYGAGFFSSGNAAILFFIMQRFPHLRSFRDLATKMEQALATASKDELNPEIRRAGIHVLMVLKRLGSLDALNVTSTSGHPKSVVDGMLDMATVFQSPNLYYFHLSSTLAPGFSPEIARLVAYSLLGAATRTRRRIQVYLFIDEFQRMVAQNLEYLLELARSMGVGVIIANQSMEDLRTMSADLITPLEANCRYRQWFSVSSSEDRKRLIESSGQTIDTLLSFTEGWGPQGRTESVTESELIVPRFSMNKVLHVSDHPKKSIVTITRGEDYAQFGGKPVIVESDFHITREEFQRRQAFAWPEGDEGSYVPRKHRDSAQAAPKPQLGPIVTTEVIGDDDELPPRGRPGDEPPFNRKQK